MKIYTCGNCSNPLYFENSTCLNCNLPVGFSPDQEKMIALKKENEADTFREIRICRNKYKFCENHQFGVCNWLVPVKEEESFCKACRLNKTIPPLAEEDAHKKWRKIEKAKLRMVYSLIRLNLPVQPKKDEDDITDPGLAFDFLSQQKSENPVLTGHANGLVTINIEEANELEIVKNKIDFGERYRTLLGHFRHEIGHYYWDILIKENQQNLTKFRSLFGDEQLDYQTGIESYYKNGAPQNWAETFISQYASAHPWEDWAESWAHYLHIMDTLETASYFNIAIKPEGKKRKFMGYGTIKNPYEIKQFKTIVNSWFPLSFAVNSLNRSMGYQDFYPFVFSPIIIEKLSFIHQVIRKNN
ncbi:MAG: putative zinc-binding peptidase [Flammeovirgaceae bacterium]|nr:putative zinc-binding peptidase [Flammeovirgaceae bacterium]